MTTASQRPAPSQWQLITLLTVVLMISYVDRGNLATAGPLIQKELGFDEVQFGKLASAFYLTYVLMMFPAGWATERFGAHRVLAVGDLLAEGEMIDAALGLGEEHDAVALALPLRELEGVAELDGGFLDLVLLDGLVHQAGGGLAEFVHVAHVERRRDGLAFSARVSGVVDGDGFAIAGA